jgi:putative hydrolase of the HAD superfamily
MTASQAARDSGGRPGAIEPGRVRAAVFDLGGVILANSVQNVERFGPSLGMAEGAWAALRQELFLDAGWWDRLERGEIALAAFAEQLRRRIADHGFAITPEQARNFMGAPGEPNRMPLRPEIVDAVRAVHATMPTLLLTNNIVEWRAGWRARLDVDALFDHVIDSSEVGMRKPEEGIYALTEETLGLPGEALFFVDDLGMNLKPARARGWQTLKYVDTAEVLRVLAALAAQAGQAGRR